MPPRHQWQGDGLSDHRAEARSAPSAERCREAGGPPPHLASALGGSPTRAPSESEDGLANVSTIASPSMQVLSFEGVDANAIAFHRIYHESSSGYGASTKPELTKQARALCATVRPSPTSSRAPSSLSLFFFFVPTTIPTHPPRL